MLYIEIIFLVTLITLLILHFRRDLRLHQKPLKPEGFSIIIPFKDEEESLPTLLLSLSNQKVSIPFEVVLIDDGSTDNSSQKVKEFSAHNPSLKIVELQNSFDEAVPLSSKQQAMEVGVAHAQYEWLVFTDADMEFNRGWLHSLFENCNSIDGRFVFGRTDISTPKNPLALLQYVQLQFLFAAAWFLAKCGIDSSCMGNNIAIEKQLYKSIGGQRGVGYSIVEDKKLFSLVRKAGVTPRPSKHFSAFAKTRAESTVKGFVNQQMRWLKGGMGESITLSVLILILISHIYATIHLLILSASPSAISLNVINWGLLAAIFLYSYCKIKAEKDIPLLIPFVLFLPIETIIFLLLLPFWKIEWKGRKL